MLPAPWTKWLESLGLPQIRSASAPISARLQPLLTGWLLATGTVSSLVGSAGATSPFLVRNWTTADGLPENTVRTILQSRDGYLWVGTAGGIARFDGIRFATFTSGNTPQLRSDSIWDLHEDRSGVVWIATARGIARLLNGIVTFVQPPPGVAPQPITQLAETSDGTLWALGSSLWRVSGLALEPVPLSANRARPSGIKAGPDGALWLATADRLGRLENGELEWVLEQRGLIDLEFEPSGAVWLLQTPGNLLRWRDGQIEERLHVTEVTCAEMSRLPNGEIWIGAKDENRAWRVLERDILEINEQDGLEGNRPIAFTMDREGNRWVGINRGGLFRLRPRKLRVFDRHDGLPILFLNSVAQDSQGAMAVALMGADLHRMEQEHFEATMTGEPGNQFHYGTSLLPAREGGVWAGTFYGPLYRVNAGRVVERIGASAGTRSLMLDRDGRLWRGTRTAGVERFDNGAVTRYAETNGLTFNDVYALAEDRDGGIWIGTERGLNRLHHGTLTRYTLADGLNHEWVHVLFSDSFGTLWIGTSGTGLCAWTGGRFVTIGEPQGLAVESVQQVLEDDLGHLWIGTRSGLFRTALADLQAVLSGNATTVYATHIGRDEGVERPQFGSSYQPSAIKDRDGTLWFCSDSGLVRIDPHQHQESATAPRVHVDQIHLDGRLVRHRRGASEPLTIPAGTEHVTINYTGLNYSAPEQVRFRYRLAGHDTDWIDAREQRQATYSQLKPGRYDFKVEAANHDGVWTREAATLPILVEPAYWQTTWFRSAIGLGLTGMLLAAYRARVSQLERRRAAQERFARQLIDSQEQERTRIAGELHDSIGQNLLVIRNLALMGIDGDPDNATVHQQLEEISDTAGRGLAEVRAISHALRPVELDRLGLSKSITAAGRRIHEISGIRVELGVERIDGLLPSRHEISLYRIVQECLNNIIKHSEATTAFIELKCEDNQVQLVISDDGKGFLPPGPDGADHDRRGLGLVSIRERARAMSGVATVRSRPGGGARIEVILPLPSTPISPPPSAGSVL